MEWSHEFHRIVSQLVEIYVNVNIKRLTIFYKTSRDHVTKFMDHQHFCQSWPGFFLGSAYFSNCPKCCAAHLCLSHLFVSHRCMQITISNRRGNHANQYTAWNYISSPCSRVIGEISTPEKEGWPGMYTSDGCQRIARSLLNIVRGLTLTLTLMSDEGKRWIKSRDSCNFRGYTLAYIKTNVRVSKQVLVDVTQIKYTKTLLY